MYIDKPHLNLIGKFEFELSLIVAEPELEYEPCDLGWNCSLISTPFNVHSLDTSSVHSDHGDKNGGL